MAKKHGKEEAPARKPPDLPNPAELAQLTAEGLLSGVLLEESRAEGLDLSGRKISALKASSSLFCNISFANC